MLDDNIQNIGSINFLAENLMSSANEIDDKGIQSWKFDDKVENLMM